MQFVADNARICGVFTIEAVGGTPTVTFKLQGTFSATDVADGSANWFDLPFVTDTNDTVVASLTKAATGSYAMWPSKWTEGRFCKRIRLVTSSNTNVTYRAALETHLI